MHACRKKSFWDSEVRQLRGQLGDSYEALLFLDLNFAAANDVEQVLWKSVFYRPIEEFRSRVKEAEKVRGKAGQRWSLCHLVSRQHLHAPCMPCSEWGLLGMCPAVALRGHAWQLLNQ